MADSLEDGVIDESEINELIAREEAVTSAYNWAVNYVKTENFTPSMLVNNPSNYAYRALSLAPMIDGSVITVASSEDSYLPQAVVSALVVVFGHGARHLAGLAVNQAEVEAAIAAQVNQAASSSSSFLGPFWGRVVVRGQVIEYRAYPIGPNTINVGTYYPPEDKEP